MKQYPKYKESGIQWIGQIPEEWEVMKSRYFSFLEHGQSYKPDDVVTENGILVLRSSNIQDGKLSLDDCVSIKPSQIVTSKLVTNDDIIICSTNGSLALVGKSMIIDRPVEASFGSFMMRMRTKQNTRFVNYQLGVIVDYYRGTFATTTINQLTIEMLGNMQFLLPPLCEQEAIVAYLDAKTGKVDESIEALEEQKADLQKYRTSVISEAVTRGLNPDVKFKDSGVQWIGQIPEEWEVIPIKRFATIQTGSTPSTSESKYFDGDFNWFTPGDFKGQLLLTDSNRKLSQCAVGERVCRVFPERSIYIIGIGGTLGKVATCEELASANQQITVVSPNDSVNHKFVTYFLSTKREIFETKANAATLPILSSDSVATFPTPVPPLSEQQAIADYLDEKTAKIDEAIKTIDEQITDLRAYRTALITEAVTGKVRVEKV